MHEACVQFTAETPLLCALVYLKGHWLRHNLLWLALSRWVVLRVLLAVVLAGTGMSVYGLIRSPSLFIIRILSGCMHTYAYNLEFHIDLFL